MEVKKEEKSLIVSTKIPKRDKYLPEEWVKKLYEAVDNVRDRAYLIYHIETGLRISEVVKGTLVSNINWKEKCADIYDFKKDRSRRITFPEVAKSAMQMLYMQDQERLTKGGRLFNFSEKTANRILKFWCNKIGFPYAKQVGTHWLRHTFIRLSRKAGRDIKFVQMQTGDTVETILEWYAELSTEEMVKEAEAKPLVK